VDFLVIQETKLEVVTENLCYSLWGDKHCEWAFFPLMENSGGYPFYLEEIEIEAYSFFCWKWLCRCLCGLGFMIKDVLL